ncbi:MAG TPA: hypothetical protein VJQ08_10300, partial [Candidatus Dormibacteraeota bacterium]|nr:hypothetical protein [Candidatus Dormibacteraeota bacterium]
AKQAGSATADYDSYALYSYEINGCTVAGLSANKTNPQPSGTAITFTVTATGCSSPEFNFWILPLGGSWQNPQPYSLLNTFVWTPTTPNTYAIVVWVRQHGGPTSSTAYETDTMTSFSSN